jgi:O-antigen/teichoic acid export membrane protein
VQFFALPILARLLSPEDYGLAAIAMPVILFVMAIADVGLGSSLVRTRSGEEFAWHTCFWLSLTVGAALALAIFLLSPIVAYALHEPRLTSIIALLAVIVALQTATMVPAAALQKDGKFGLIAATEFVAIIASIGTAIALAGMDYGVWALIWQQVVFYLVRVVLTMAFSPYRPRLLFRLPDAWEHINFGRNILGVNLITFASRSFENLAIGRVYGPDPVGIYSMASQFARLPVMIVTGPLQYVLYPHVAALRDNKMELARTFLLVTRLVALTIVPAIGLMAIASEPIFHLMLSKKWAEAAPIFVLIAPAAALQPVTAILGTFMMALGRTDLQMRLAAQFAVLWFLGLLASLWYGIEAVALTYSVCSFIFSLWSLRACLPLLGCSLANYGRELLWPAATTGAGILIYLLLAPIGQGHEGVDTLLAGGVAGFAILGSLLVLGWQELGGDGHWSRLRNGSVSWAAGVLSLGRGNDKI